LAVSLITKELKKLALKYRKEWNDDKILDMSETTAETLKYVPAGRIPELFKAAFEANRYFPDDRQILKTWMGIKNKNKAGRLGYYDCWGIFTLTGTFYTWMTRPMPEWFVSGETDEYIKFKAGRMTEDEEILYKNKRWYSVRGQIQKPREEWNIDDNSFQDRFNAEYESMRKKYLPQLGFNYQPA